MQYIDAWCKKKSKKKLPFCTQLLNNVAGQWNYYDVGEEGPGGFGDSSSCYICNAA